MKPRDPIKVVELAGSPSNYRYMATFGEWDLGDPIGMGETEEAAIEDLHWDAGDDE